LGEEEFMTGTRIFLGLSALFWLPYGIFCLVQPGFLEGAAGVASSTPTGSAELRAMYGGLQAGVGALALAGFLRTEVARPALLTLLFLCAGLALGRLLGLVVDGAASPYTLIAVGFEVAWAALAAALLGRPAPAPAL
jgi:hypothetical protein